MGALESLVDSVAARLEPVAALLIENWAELGSDEVVGTLARITSICGQVTEFWLMLPDGAPSDVGVALVEEEFLYWKAASEFLDFIFLLRHSS